MPESAIDEILPVDLEEHRAVKAWHRVHPRAFDVEDVQILKSRRKSAVYRLIGSSSNRPTMIAKRSEAPTARLERLLYEEVLARLPLPALRCHGFLEEPGGQFCWLFLEDACGQEYSPRASDHRFLSSRWLATVHAISLAVNVADRLPDRGPRHYLRLLRSCRETALRHLENPALLAEDRSVLRGIASQCDVVESHWGEVASFCETLPRTLVHGDLAVKNVRVRVGRAGPALLAFDWENAGWGVPGTDLCQFTGLTLSPDLQAYCGFLRRMNRPLDLSRAGRLAVYGGIFRVLDVIGWAAFGLVFDARVFLVKPMSELKIYESWLAAALEAAGWGPRGGFVPSLA